MPEPSTTRPTTHWEDTDGVPVGLPRLVDGPDDRPAQLEPVSLQPEGADIDDDDVMALGSETMEIQREQLLADDEEWEDEGDDALADDEDAPRPAPSGPVEEPHLDEPDADGVSEPTSADRTIAVLEARLAAAETRAWALGALGLVLGAGGTAFFLVYLWNPGTLGP